MKKTYITPAITVVDMQPVYMMASSTTHPELVIHDDEEIDEGILAVRKHEPSAWDIWE